MFDLYARKLCSNDANTFIEIAEKLAFWLSNEKAYYEQARPEIVKLLLVAQSTLRRAVNAADPAIPFHVSQHIAHPLVPSYINLIEVVKRFIHLFVEQELELYLRYIVSTVVNLNPPPPPPPPVRIQSPQTNQEQSDPSSTGLSDHQTSSSTIPSTSHISTPPVESESPAMMDPTVPSQKGAVQKVKKKRKPLDYLIDVDLRKFRETATAMQTQTVVVEPANQEVLHEPEADKCKVSEPSEAILPPNLSRKSSLSVQAISLGRVEEPLPVLKTAGEEVKTASDHDSQKPIVQDTQGGRNGRDVPRTASTTQMALEGTASLKGNVTDPTIQLLWIQDAATAAVPEGSGHLKSAPADRECEASIVSPQRVSAEHVASGNPDMVLSEPVDGAETHMVGVGDEVKASEDVDMTVAEEDNQELVQGKHQNLNDGDIRDEPPTQTTVLEKIEELHTKLSLCVSQPPLDHELKLSIESRLSSEEYLERQEIRSLLGLDDERNGISAEMDTTDGRPEGLLVEVPKPLHHITDEDGMMRNLFERIKVPAFVKGLRNPGRVTINFNIKPAVHLALSRWTEKSCHSASDINDAMCITLGCYKATEAALSAIANNDEQGWKEFISTHQSSWPKTGGLQLILTAQQRYNLPLSPPIIVSSDGLLDISNLLVAGPNSFELRSHRDMSKYVFALAVHPPTPSQSSLHYEYCKKEQDWQNWITSLSQPFNVNSLPAFAR